MANQFLLSLLRDRWLIDPVHAESWLPVVVNAINGTTEFEKQENQVALSFFHGNQNHAAVLSVKNNYDLNLIDWNNIPAGAAVVIPIAGPLLKADAFCGPVGMMTMAGIVNNLGTKENISTLVFEFDTPGGQVAGLQTLADAIKNSPKRTIGVVREGVAASAGYWLLSSCDEAYASRKTDQVGSIGVFTRLVDFKGALEASGIKVHEIYSRLSSEKNKGYKDAIEGDYTAMQDDLDILAEEFIAAVKSNRPNINIKAGDPFKGAVFYAPQAIEIGLIDGIKSFDEIISLTNSNMETNTGANAGAETNAPEITQENVVAFVAALDEQGRSNLNASLKESNLQVVAGDTRILAAEEAAAFDSFKQSEALFNDWKSKSDAGHTSTGDGKDKLEIPSSAVDLFAQELSYLNEKYGL